MAKYNDKKRFDIVVGVFLSPITKASDGALLVLPASHTHERAVRLAGQLADGALRSEGVSCGAESLSSSEAILCRPGSVIVFDKDLLHAGAPNLSPHIRFALYARMRWEELDAPGR